MNRSLWLQTLSEKECPPWPCPVCNAGTLRLVDKSLLFQETVESVLSHKHEAFDPDWVEYFFTAWAKCNYASCGQKFAIAGSGGVEPEYQENQSDWAYENFFTPLFCRPMPHLIQLPEGCPKEITEELFSSFRVFWSNPESCASRIRVTLELIMNHLGVPKRRKNKKGQFSDLTLHGRIDAYATKEPVLGRQLMALKWLGNTGSHSGQVAAADLLDAFEILEDALAEILGRRSARVAKLAKNLVKKHAR